MTKERAGAQPVPQRTRILEAAADLFKRKGFDGTSMQDVADAVGILKGSLYHYIKSKEDLLFWIMEETHERGLANIERCRRMDASAHAKLSSFLYGHVLYNLEHDAKAAAFYRGFQSMTGDRRQALVRARATYDKFLMGLLAEGQEAGDIRGDLSPRMMANFLFGAANSVYQWYEPTGPFNPEEIAEQYAELGMTAISLEA